MRGIPQKALLVVLVAAVTGAFALPGWPGPAPAAEAAVLAAPVTEPWPLTLDPTFAAPAEPVGEAARSAIAALLEEQARALRSGNAAAYLATFAPASASPPAATGAPSPAGAGLAVAGEPALRAAHDLFAAIPAGSVVELADIRPLFIVPGPDGQAEVLARHVAAYRSTGGQTGILEVNALERLRPVGGSAWQVFDWTNSGEDMARLTWPVWLDGQVTLQPFDGELQARLTYTFFPGFFAGSRPATLDFDLADTFKVTAVELERPEGTGGRVAPGSPATRALAWERGPGGELCVSLPPESPPTGAGTSSGAPLRLTFTYHGYVTPSGTPRRGNLDYLGAEAIYLRPDTGWYPRPFRGGQQGGLVRGFLAVTVPGWWAAAAPGRLVAASPHASGSDAVRTFTWGLDLPAEIYLVAGPYVIGQATTANGVNVRAFFDAREAVWNAAYLREVERILDFFGAQLVPYPYADLTLAEVQNFYYGGLSARTLVLLEKEWMDDPEGQAWARDLLSHEISHQWWGEVIPIQDQPDWFLWEGLASYSEALYAEAREGREGLARVMAQKTENYAEAAAGHSGWSVQEANARNTDWQDSFVYDKGAWVFHTLRFLLGDERFFSLLRTYLNRFAGRQPSTADLGALVAEAAPGDAYLASFTRHAVDEPGDVDLELRDVSVSRIAAAGGVAYRLRFTLVDTGTGSFPRAQVKVTLKGEPPRTFTVPAGVNTLDLPAPVTGLEVDPAHTVLDLDRGNNRYYVVLGLPLPGAARGPAEAVALAAALGLIALAYVRRLLRRGPRRTPPPPSLPGEIPS